MPLELDDLIKPQKPTANRPLLGLTVLIVEDSRFASEALRLLCLRSGARIRRADTIAHARRHLQVYRPNVVLVDLGLPDGSGAELIDELARSTPRVEAVLGLSGDTGTEHLAKAAGADGFVAKPISNLGAFQQVVLDALPEGLKPNGIRTVPDEEIFADPSSLQDDFVHIADILTEAADGDMLNYIAQFLSGLARISQDSEMEGAAQTLAQHREEGLPFGPAVARVAGLVHDRIDTARAS